MAATLPFVVALICGLAAVSGAQKAYWVTPCKEFQALPASTNFPSSECNASPTQFDAHCYPTAASNLFGTILDSGYPDTVLYSGYPLQWADRVMTIAIAVGTTINTGTDPGLAATKTGLETHAQTLGHGFGKTVVTYTSYDNSTGETQQAFWVALNASLTLDGAVLLHLPGSVAADLYNVASTPLYEPNGPEGAIMPTAELPIDNNQQFPLDSGSTLGHTVTVYEYGLVNGGYPYVLIAFGMPIGNSANGKAYIKIPQLSRNRRYVMGYTSVHGEIADDNNDEGLSTGAIVGIAIGAAVLASLIVLAIVMHRRKTQPYEPVSTVGDAVRRLLPPS